MVCAVSSVFPAQQLAKCRAGTIGDPRTDTFGDQGIVHCDIKGGNILVTNCGVIKLADFNSSKQLGNIANGGSNPLRSLLGTPQFMAPEVIRQTGHGKKADVWSVGCTVVQMLTGMLLGQLFRDLEWNVTLFIASLLCHTILC